MSSETQLTGRVVQPPTGPVGDVSVVVVDGDGDGVARTETGADGRFSLTVTADATDVAARLVVGDAVEEPATEALDGDGEVGTVMIPPGEAVGGAAADGGEGPSLGAGEGPSAGGGETAPDSGAPSAGGGEGPSEGAMRMMMEPYGDDATGLPEHGSVSQRGMTETPTRPAASGHGRFGALFDFLPAASHEPAFLELLGAADGPMDVGDEELPERADYPPAGYVFYGQFVDHDITLDTTSSLDRQVDPAALRNFRTPGLDLDNVYGAGHEADRHLYARRVGGAQDNPYKLLLRENDAGELADLARNSQNTALIGDPRNDENQLVSQLHCSMIGAHNRIIERLEAAGEAEGEAAFEEAQQLLRWHHQYLVVNDFLPRVCEESVLADVLENGREFYTPPAGETPFIPVEFAGAAYRYGHSRIEERYRLNDSFAADLFQANGGDTLRGFRPVSSERTIDWSYFFDLTDTEFDGAASEGDVQRVAPIDTKLPESLHRLPFTEPSSLAARNLLRGRRLGLPSGQAVARAMGVEVFTADDLGYDDDVETVRREHGVEPGDEETPLWYYVLAEAAVDNGGARLGPVGSRLVAETLVGLIDESRASYRTLQPNWTPEFVESLPFDEELTVGELLAFGAASH